MVAYCPLTCVFPVVSYLIVVLSRACLGADHKGGILSFDLCFHGCFPFGCCSAWHLSQS